MTDCDWIALGQVEPARLGVGGPVAVEGRASDKGMAALSGAEAFATELARITEGWPLVPVITCGMVGARQAGPRRRIARSPAPLSRR